MFNALSKYKAVSVIETSTDLAYFQHILTGISFVLMKNCHIIH